MYLLNYILHEKLKGSNAAVVADLLLASSSRELAEGCSSLFILIL